MIKNHINSQEIKYVDELFSTKRLDQIKENCKIDPAYQEKIHQVLQDLDHIFGKLKENINKIIDDECKKAKNHVKERFSADKDNERIMKIVIEHEQMLRDLFTEDELTDSLKSTVNPYLESFTKISETFRTQIQMIENRDKNIELYIKNFPKINQKHQDLVDIMQNNISNYDELYNHLKSKDQLQSFKSNEILLQKLQTGIISKVDLKLPRLHTAIINKIINYENNTKYITCSKDKTIIIRSFKDNKIIRTLSDNKKSLFSSLTKTYNNHKESVCDILLLLDGRLASCSQDKTIKIWNLTSGNCEQTLVGHSDWVYCLLELPNSILLSGSGDSIIGIWDISQKNKNELQFYHQVKNEKQSKACCMTLISINELAVSSHKDINIYLFDNTSNNKSFNIIKTLKGHNDWVLDIKLMCESKDMLISCSGDKDCRLWSISQENCLRIFKGHSDMIWSIQTLSKKIFVSASAEIIFWDIDSNEIIRSIKPDQSGNHIVSLIKYANKELIFAGMHDFIGFILI